jgi:Tfp pilus assembly protein PilX
MLKVRVKKSQQEGVALVTAIFALLIATVIGIAVYYTAIISFTIAVNERNNTEAFYIADAGVNHAVALIGKAQKTQYSAILKAGDATPNTGDELSVAPLSGLWTSAQSIPAGNVNSGGVVNFGAGGGGRYWVAVKNDSAVGETATIDLNGILIVTATGVGRDGATATVEVTIKDNSANYPGVLINGKAKISGSVKISGSNGSLHANDTLIINGNPCADQYFSSSADIQNSNNLKGMGCVGIGFNRTNQPVIEPPIFDIRNDFYGKTDYILGGAGLQAGKVFNGSGQLIHDTKNTGNKWTKNGSTWEWFSSLRLWVQSGSTIVNGSYYSEGNMAITANFGTSAIPARVSFIAEGFIYNQGKQYLAPAYRNFSFVAGTDLKLTGKLTQAEVDDLEVDGFNYALHQIDFAGTPVIRGSVVAANQADTNSPGCSCNLVPLDSGFMNIRGNATIISDGINTSGGVAIKSWREVRF